MGPLGKNPRKRDEEVDDEEEEEKQVLEVESTSVGRKNRSPTREQTKAPAK